MQLLYLLWLFREVTAVPFLKTVRFLVRLEKYKNVLFSRDIEIKVYSGDMPGRFYSPATGVSPEPQEVFFELFSYHIISCTFFLQGGSERLRAYIILPYLTVSRYLSSRNIFTPSGRTGAGRPRHFLGHYVLGRHLILFLFTCIFARSD